MARCHGRFALVSGSALLALSFLSATSSRAATHYPPGAICYDCHAVSKSKMVLGTHLLKKSDRTVALGISSSSPQAPCLFCHDKNAVPSAVGRDRMLGVWDHFGASSASKHPADIRSGFGGNASALDCLDCHAGITVGVDSDGSGNATVHGLDASGDTRLDLYGSLVGTPGDASQVSAATCRNDACHSATGTTTGGYSAPARHGTAQTTIVGGAAPSACTDCHGTHNSYQNTSLVTLRTDGTTSNNPGDPLATRVTPEKCGACHTQDDGPAGGPYAAKGHGQGTISGGSLGCTACHEGSVPHGFSRSAQGTNPLRFKYAENTSVQSAIRREPPYHQAYSICLTCHGIYAGKLHGGSDAVAGCNDCHEPHGAGVEANVAMVRVQIPKVDPAGTPVYGDGSAAAPYETNSYLASGDATYKTDGTGLCDNRECHQGRVVAGDAIYPLSTFLTGGAHSGGDIATGTDFVCQSCHTHTDDGGSWGAKASCTLCHGQPPVSAATASEGYARFAEAASPHRRHAAPRDQGGYGYHCTICHLGYTSTATHNTDPKSYTDVLFDPAANPGGAAYTPATATCANLYCHSDGQSSASVASVQWMSGFDTPNWNVQNLACNACHGGVAGATRIATGSHAAHLAWSGVTCFSCHADTVAAVDTDTTTVLPSAGIAAHVNGTKNLKVAGTFGGQAVSFVPGAGSCAQISCHGGNGAAWGTTLACAGCHLRPAAQGGDRDNYLFGDGLVAAAAAEEWAAAGHGRPGAAGSYPSGNPAAAFSGPASDPQGCAYCHAFLGTAQNPAAAHGEADNPFRLANRGALGRGVTEDGGWNDACLVCHHASRSGYDPDGAGGYASRNGAAKVDENHYGSRHADPTRGGAFCWDCHDPHGDTQHYMVHSGDGSAPGRGVTAQSDGTYGMPVASRPVTGLDVASAAYTSADLAHSGNTGLCQTCHAASGGARYYNRSTFTPLTSHNGADTVRCTTCHRHEEGFPGCTDCHGDPAAGTSWPDGATNNPNVSYSWADDAGAHAAHIAALGTGNRSCTTCHPGNPPAGHPADTATGPEQAEVIRMDADGDGTPEYWRFAEGATASSGTAVYFRTMAGAPDPDATFRLTDRRCANIDCHGGATTPAWYGDEGLPAATAVAATPTSIQRGTATVSLSASCSDAGSGGSEIIGSEHFVDIPGTPGTGTPMVASDGAFDSSTEIVTAVVESSAWAGDTTLYVHCRDSLGNWGPLPPASVAVIVTPQDDFAASLAAGMTETVLQGDTNVTMASVTLSVTAGSSVVLRGFQVTGTGSGSPSANVAAAKIYADGGTVPDAWDPSDSFLGSAWLDAANVANIPIPDTAVASGTPLRILIVYDVTAAAAAGSTLGASLTGISAAPTDRLTTALPLSSGNVKTVAASLSSTYYLNPSNGVPLAGSLQTSFGLNCGGGDRTVGTHYTLLTSPEACGSSTVWTPTGAVNSNAVFNSVVSTTRSFTFTGAASGNAIRVQNVGTTTRYVYVYLFELTSVGGVGNITSAFSIGIPAGYNGTQTPNLSTRSVVVRPGSKFGVRFYLNSADLRLYMGASQTYVAASRAPVNDTQPPTLSVAPATSPSAIQAGTESVTLSATCTDASTGGSAIAGAEYFVGTEGMAATGIPMLAQDGAFNSSTEAVIATVDASAWTADTPLYVDCKDAAGRWGPATAGSTVVAVAPKDPFTLSAAAGPAENVAQGRRDAVMARLTFEATGPGAAAVQGLQIAGTMGAGTGTLYGDVSRVHVYDDGGTRSGVWDPADVLLGSGTFGAAGTAEVDFADFTVTYHDPVVLYVVYDISPRATVGDELGAAVTAVRHPATDQLTTALPVSSGNIKTVVSGGSISCGECHGIPPADAAAGGSHTAHASSQPECANCHGAAAASYTNAHPNGVLQLGFKTPAPAGPTVLTGTEVTYEQGGTVIYRDLDGAGGLNALPGSDGVDDGTCSGFGALGVTGCHGGSSPAWGTPGSAACGTCHGTTAARDGYREAAGGWLQGAPPSDLAGKSSSLEVGRHLLHLDLSHAKTGTSCALCHYGAGKNTGFHGDGTVQVSFRQTVAGGPAAAWSDSGTDAPPGGTCSGLNQAACHTNTTWNASTQLSCQDCHQLIVSHTRNQGAAVPCTNCHPGGAYAPIRHSTNGRPDILQLPLPPASWSDPSGRLSGADMQTRLGLPYRIHLGGDDPSSRGTSEASVCWGCHDSQSPRVSEWGYNSKSTPAGYPVAQLPTGNGDGTAETYNHGWIYDSSYGTKVSDWTAGYWQNAYDTSVTRRVSSVHTATFDPAGQSSSVSKNVDASGLVIANPVLEQAGHIRCSFCHDVHDLNRSLEEKPVLEGGHGRPMTGKPWLRGKWAGNPYPADVPARSNYTYTTRARSAGDLVPRMSAAARDKGGYFIDQNSNNPTNHSAMDTVEETAGLCLLCHGADVNQMDFYTGSSLWRAGTVNGHSNSTLGGTGSVKRNLFDGNRAADWMGRQQYVGAWGFGGAGAWLFTTVYNSGWYGGTPGSTTRGGDYSAWYTTGGIGGRTGVSGAKAHDFTCSKCHSPHAAGLPALLTSNCVNTGRSGLFTLPLMGANTPATWDPATNCHRKTSTATGWHRIAPGQ